MGGVGTRDTGPYIYIQTYVYMYIYIVFSHPTFLGLVHTMVLRVPITSCHLASIGRESPDVQWKLGSGRPLEGFRGDVAVADHSSVCSHKRRCCVLRRALGISLRSCYLCRDSALVAEPTGSRLPLDSFFFVVRTVGAEAVCDPGCQGQLPRVMELIIQRCLEPQMRPCRTYHGP